jgi:hypothetical protein
VFGAARPSFADVVQPSLEPRAAWMKATSPIMTDEEADRVWCQSNDVLFGTRSPTILELTQQISNLQKLLDQRKQDLPNPIIHEDKQVTRETSAWRHPIAQGMQSRFFRQGVKGDTADKNIKKAPANQHREMKVFRGPRMYQSKTKY